MTNIIDLSATEMNEQHSDVGARYVDVSKGSYDSVLSNQWFSRPHDERFLSLHEMRDNQREAFENSTNIVTSKNSVEILAPEFPESLEDTRKLSIGLPNGDEVTASHWSFGQLCQLSKAPASYMRDLPSQLVADNLTWSMRNRREVENFACYYNQTANHLRAVTGPDYGRIGNYEVIESIIDFAGDGRGTSSPWKVPGTLDWSTRVYDPDTPITLDNTTLFASDRDMFVFLVDDRNPIQIGWVTNPKTGQKEPDYLFRGFYVTNSEEGSKALKIAVFYLRGVCGNRMLWGIEHFEEVVIRHTKFAADRFLHEASPALMQYASGSVMSIQQGVENAKSAIVAEEKKEALNFLHKRGLSRKKALQVFDTHTKEEGFEPSSVWDMANGITAVARNEPNNDTRIDMEKTAGKLLDKVAA